MKSMTLLLIAIAAAAGAEYKVEAVRTAEKAWAAATVAGDESSLKKLLADDLTYTHSTGVTDSKAVYISNLKTGVRRYNRLDYDPGIEVRIYGDTAVLRATAQVITSSQSGQPSAVHLRFLHVWVWQHGRWQLVAHQSLRLPD